MSTDRTHLERRTTARGVPAWVGFACFSVIVGAAYFVIPRVGLSLAWCDLIYTVFAAVCATAIIVGVRRNRTRARAAWMLIAAGQLVFVLADVIYTAQHTLLRNEYYPGPGDYLYLISYPLSAVGLAVLVRRRTPNWHLSSVLDGATLVTGAGLLSWVYLVKPLHDSTVGSTLQGALVTVSYPLGSLLVLTVATFLVLGVGTRPRAFYLLVGGLTANLVADVVYTVQATQGSYVTGAPVDMAWLLGYALIALAALHPSMRRMDERSPVMPPDATWGRLTALAIASLAAPGVLAVQYVRGAELFVPVVVGASALLFLLVLARMAMLVAIQRREAITDALTGLHTRRFFEESLRASAVRARRHGGGFGVVLLDIDNFKEINDTYGHPGGDQVLCEVARRLRSSARDGDVIARYGGEEFGFLLPGAGNAELADFAERLRVIIAGTPVTIDGRAISVTVSGGTALWPADGSTSEDVVLAADRALYRAKNAGRNRIAGARRLAAAA